MARLLLVDGNSLAYRAFFALPTDMATASGQVTNAVYGFTSMLINLVKDHTPDGIVVAFDRPEPTFRHELVPDYKEGRAAAPDILRQQMGLIRQVVDTLDLPVVEVAGYEADDVIATLATRARDREIEVIVVTGDRDTYQLVEDPWVKVLYNRRGVSDYALYDEAGILERTGVAPALYPQYAALRGDPSDNLPGVPGVGEKTAARLLTTYGDLDGVFAHVESQTPKLRENLTAHEEQVRRNALATPLVRDVPIDLDVEGVRLAPFDPDTVRELFGFLEFRLYDRLVEAYGQPALAESGERLEVTPERPAGAGAVAAALAGLAGPGATVAVVAAWEGEVGRSSLAGLACAPGGAGSPAVSPGGAGSPAVSPGGAGSPAVSPGGAGSPAVSPGGAGSPAVSPGGAGSPGRAVWLDRALLVAPEVHAGLEELTGGGAAVVTHRAKELMRGLARLRSPQGPVGDVDLPALDLDCALAAYLLDPAGGDQDLDDLARRYLGLDLAGPEAPPEGQLDLEGRGQDLPGEAARRAVAVARLAPALRAGLEARGLSRLHDEVERPLVRVLARMEEVGVRVDRALLEAFHAGVVAEAAALEARIQELAGRPFLVGSTVQLRAVLYDELGLEPQKRTKTGYSTDAASLERLRGQHPIVEPLLRYREAEKLRSTYGEGLLGEIGPDGRIHASFNQTVARTGRLSSDRPNLHNIPVRTDEGRRIRAAFVPTEGCRFLVADYDQIELRVIAHLAEDPGLVAAFASGTDIHNATAARIFGVAPESVTLAQRSKAKMVSYGLAYGMEAYGLGQRLGIPTDEAAVILAAYFDAFPAVRAYMERTVAEARDRGYTETLFGRRRQIPELASPNYRVRQAGERQAMNAGIQGLAADLFKLALVRLDRALEGRGLASRLVLQVHDEVILEVPPAEEDVAAELTREAMVGVVELSVPLTVNLCWGRSWAEAKG